MIVCVVDDGSCDAVWFVFFFCVFEGVFVESVPGCCVCKLLCGDV